MMPRRVHPEYRDCTTVASLYCTKPLLGQRGMGRSREMRGLETPSIIIYYHTVIHNASYSHPLFGYDSCLSRLYSQTDEPFLSVVSST
jgi:hypothetical protein